ncbi:MAG TPA: hypothetical protein VKS21_03175, partial [Spirochaetota bacterium]|nr:hypothetical protein [Spirochaetota bacterium]
CNWQHTDRCYAKQGKTVYNSRIEAALHSLLPGKNRYMLITSPPKAAYISFIFIENDTYRGCGQLPADDFSYDKPEKNLKYLKSHAQCPTTLAIIKTFFYYKQQQITAVINL